MLYCHCLVKLNPESNDGTVRHGRRFVLLKTGLVVVSFSTTFTARSSQSAVGFLANNDGIKLSFTENKSSRSVRVSAEAFQEQAELKEALVGGCKHPTLSYINIPLALLMTFWIIIATIS